MFLKRNIIGGFQYNGYYWSSSEYDHYDAWILIVDSTAGVHHFLFDKPNTYNVRAIRSFSLLNLQDSSNCVWVSNSGWNYLTVTDSLGCTSTDSVYVDISPCYIFGCTDTLACNYDSTATFDYGS